MKTFIDKWYWYGRGFILLSFGINLHDLWIGLYWKRCSGEVPAYDLYFCPFPSLVFNLYIQV